MSPAIEHVDGSSGAIGAAVNHAVAELVPLIAGAPVDATSRHAWLERLFEAHAADQMPYIERLTDHWGALCDSAAVASGWGDRLMGITRMALSPDTNLRGYFHGTSACLSALFTAGRYDEIIDLVKGDTIWPYKRWAVKALAAQGNAAGAIDYAERCRSAWAGDQEIDERCEEILLSSGRADEAYARYALNANRTGTCLTWFRAIARKYPHKPAADVLADLVRHTPGDEGKWFAAAKDAGFLDTAIALANRAPCDPRTLTRAARDFAEKNPAFAIDAGITALRWLVQGHGYEITSADVWAAYANTMTAAEKAGRREETCERIRMLIAGETQPNPLVTTLIGPEIRRG